MLRLYDYATSGNSYKAHLVMHLLGLQHEIIPVDILKGESRTEDFLQNKSPNGRIPVLEFEDGRMLWESHAIIWYLADGTELLPDDPWKRAKIMQWLCFEQYNLEPNVAVARFWLHIKPTAETELTDRLAEWRKKGNEALSILNAALKGSDFLVGNKFSIADIGLYAYTHVAHEGGFDLNQYPNIQSWIKRIEAIDNFLPMPEE